MDPVSVAVRHFAADIEDFWRAHPERLQPLVAAESDRELVVQALRAREHASDNRRPFVVCEEPFVAMVPYFAELERLIAIQYEAIRSGAAEERVMLPPFTEASTPPSEDASPLAPAALAADRVALLLGGAFEGLVVALVPSHVADAAAWREAVAVLLATRWAPRVRWAVFSPPGGSIADLVGVEGAHLELDPAAVASFLSQQKLEAAGGDRGGDVAAAAPAVPATVRALVLRATQAQADGDIRRAAQDFRDARALCRTEGLTEQEAMVLMALAGTLMTAGKGEPAAETYREAATLAEAAEAWAPAASAWMGLGGAYAAQKELVAAALAFRGAADAARRAGLVPMQIEGHRMAGVCFLRLGREDDALAAWNEAVELGSGAEPAERRASSLSAAGEALVKLLQKRGLDQQAAHVRQVLVAGEADETGARSAEGAG
jgi:hypothetical protein